MWIRSEGCTGPEGSGQNPRWGLPILATEQGEANPPKVARPLQPLTSTGPQYWIMEGVGKLISQKDV